VGDKDDKNNREQQDKTQFAVLKNKTDDSCSALDPCLTQLSGTGSGQVFNLKNRVLKIGRDRNCDLWIEDPHISRIHATLSNQDEVTSISDEGSTNGVFINGKKVTKQILKNGDRILIGTRLHFKYSLEFADYQQVQNQKYIQANYDSLTKLYNKRFFSDIISKEFSFHRRNKNPLSLLMIDIDYFKKINDQYGHLVGDSILAQVGEIIRTSIRHENIACRYGGEEFSVLLRNTGPLAAEVVAERIRKAVETADFAASSHPIKVTVSVGIATYDHQNFETYEELIKFADELLYESKLGGRNKITLKKVA
jgi:diguanylate cyclase (GGDEF)-like protein